MKSTELLFEARNEEIDLIEIRNIIGEDALDVLIEDELEQESKESDYESYILYDQGKRYAEGVGVKQNLAKARKLFRKAAKQGNAQAQYEIGIAYIDIGYVDSKTTEKGLDWLEKAAEQGIVEAQYRLGKYYQKDIGGFCLGEPIAVGWFKKAAEQGFAEAQLELGMYYVNRYTSDDILAFEYFEKAAEQGLAKAQYVLGQCYYKGRGIWKDKRLAAEWLDRAAKQGEKEAKKLLKVIEKEDRESS
jgi:uncharacterized protein